MLTILFACVDFWPCKLHPTSFRYHFHHSGKRIDTKGVASDTIAKHFMRAMHGGAEPKPEQVRVSLSSNGHFSEYRPTLHLDKHVYGSR